MVIDAEHEKEAAFAFRNGHFNAVFSTPFTDTNCYDRISDCLRIAAELRTQPAGALWSGISLVILGSVFVDSEKKRRSVAATFKRNAVLYFDNPKVLANHVEREAHELDNDNELFKPVRLLEPFLFKKYDAEKLKKANSLITD